MKNFSWFVVFFVVQFQIRFCVFFLVAFWPTENWIFSSISFLIFRYRWFLLKCFPPHFHFFFSNLTLVWVCECVVVLLISFFFLFILGRCHFHASESFSMWCHTLKFICHKIGCFDNIFGVLLNLLANVIIKNTWTSSNNCLFRTYFLWGNKDSTIISQIYLQLVFR